MDSIKQKSITKNISSKLSYSRLKIAEMSFFIGLSSISSLDFDQNLIPPKTVNFEIYLGKKITFPFFVFTYSHLLTPFSHFQFFRFR